MASSAVRADTLYVYGSKVPVYDKPAFNSPTVATVYRGTALEVQPIYSPAQEWRAVKYKKISGWIPSLVLGIVPPRKQIPAKDLADFFEVNKHTATDYRKRISENSHVQPANVHGNKFNQSLRDMHALHKMESVQISDDDSAKFHEHLRSLP